LQPQPRLKGFGCFLLQQKQTTNAITIGNRQEQLHNLSIMPDKHPLPHKQIINKIISKYRQQLSPKPKQLNIYFCSSVFLYGDMYFYFSAAIIYYDKIVKDVTLLPCKKINFAIKYNYT